LIPVTKPNCPARQHLFCYFLPLGTSPEGKNSFGVTRAYFSDSLWNKKMPDDFYGPFDRDLLINEWNYDRTPDYRSVFHQDRDRIMFSPVFRRLQAKTQVFQAGEYDFYRTRLTHSLEVSRIAESIAIWLRKAHPEVQIDLHLLEGVCLAHDIGHPPFGHAGERVLNELMGPFGGFEGNAQTLRILTQTIYSRAQGGRGGMTPSRALLDGVLKYKRLYRDRGKDTNHFIYDDQAEILDFCFRTRDLRGKLDADKVNEFKSLECQIMDLADDIAYSSFDIVDGWKARFLTPDKLEAWCAEKDLDPDYEKRLGDLQQEHLRELIGLMAEGSLQPKMNVLIGKLIQSTSLKTQNNFMTKKTRRYGYKLLLKPVARAHIKLQKALCRELVYGSSALQQIEFKGGEILKKLAKTLLENYLCTSSEPKVLVPTEAHRAVMGIHEKAVKARLLCDHLAGMTDAYALRSYKRLFHPDYGSISELI
jgi:dGTPase